MHRSKAGTEKKNMTGRILMISKKQLIAIVAIILLASLLPVHALFSNNHKLFMNETISSQFCSKCHPASSVNVSAGVHATINCFCHGYDPVVEGVNKKHNLTKKIYCTNCHTKYDENTGDITIKPGVSGKNQSAHYLIRNKTDPQLYNNSRNFFNP
jgi:hypothetical protein